MIRYKKTAALLCAAALLFSLAGCGRQTADQGDLIPESTGGKDLVSSYSADNVLSLNCYRDYSFNPLIATNHSNQLVCSLVYENMVELDNNFNIIPGAGIITKGECNDDGTSWRFDIDTTHTFHDGSAVTGRDLRYSLERAINCDRYSGRFASFQGVSYDKDYIIVSLGIGDTDFMKLLNIPVIQFGTYQDDYPGGSGPYMYNEDHTALIPYEPYFVTKEYDPDDPEAEPTVTPYDPPINTIYLKEYSTMEDTLSTFEDGIIDIALNDPSSYTNLGYASTDEVHSFATTNMHYVMCNQSKGMLSDSTVRYALNFAFNRANFVKLLGGNAVASAVPMYPTCSIYPNMLNDKLSYDIDTVKRIFENAGIKDYDEDGICEYMNAGTEINLRFIVCSDSSAKTGVVERFAEDMASIGVTIDVQELTWKEYKEALYEGEFDLYYGEIKLRNNFDITELLQVRPEDADEFSSNLNFSGSRDENYLTYINNYLGASSFEKAAKYRELTEYIANNGALITIGFERQELITHRGVCRGIEPNAGNPLYDFAHWTIHLDD